MFYRSIVFALLILFMTQATQAAGVHYVLSFSEPHGHYADVEMRFANPSGKQVKVQMPVWTPGSYLVREYAKNVEQFAARSSTGQELQASKQNKNTWVINAGAAKEIVVTYKVYCYELTVRNAYVDHDMAYLNGAAVFMYVPELAKEGGDLTIKPLPHWKQISTALPAGKDKFTRSYANLDELLDSPVQVGNHRIFEFKAANVPHSVALVGDAYVNEERLRNDMIKIVNASVAIFGEHPCKEYVFIVHIMPNGSGGLEHLNSTTLQASPAAFVNESQYQGFLGLVSHEYFHLWNVKRLRPMELGPFNYAEENYTRLLWVAEGFTSYYDDLILRRAGLISPNRYIDIIASNMGAVRNNQGDAYQSLSEASLDAWIKYYRPNENSGNSTVSYYTKGAVISMLMDLEIREATQGKKSLDDVLRYLYDTYYKKKQRGFTEAEIREAIEQISGKSFAQFFADYIDGTKQPDYAAYMNKMGLRITDRNASSKDPFLGMSTSNQGGRLVVGSVMRNSPAMRAGIYVNDEIVAVNNWRTTTDINSALSGVKQDETIPVIISRGGRIVNTQVKLGKSPYVNYAIEPDPGADSKKQVMRKAWLEGDL